MEVLRRLEDDVRNLGAEAKKKYPEVVEASDKVLQELRTMRELYVADVMKKGSVNASPKSYPSFSFRSSILTSPYILACNYGDSNSKSMLALNGIHMLLECDAFDPSEAPNVVRVLSIQSTGKADIQIKVLQLLLQIVNFLLVDGTVNTVVDSAGATDQPANPLVADSGSIAFLSEELFCRILSISLCLCDPATHTALVASTALSTSRQCISLLMERVSELELRSRNIELTNSSKLTPGVVFPESQPTPPLTLFTSLRQIVFNIVQEMSGIVIRGSSPTGGYTCNNTAWLKGVLVPVPFALDVLCGMLEDSTVLFQYIPFYVELLNSYILSQPSQGNLIMIRVIRLSRSVLLHHVREECLEEVETIMTLMSHTLHPDYNHPNENNAQSSNGNAISRFLKGNSSGPAEISGSGSANSTIGNSLFLPLQKDRGHNGPMATCNIDVEYIPSHPAAACLASLISLFLRPHFIEDFVFAAPTQASPSGSAGRHQRRGRSIGASCISTIMLSLCRLINESIGIDSNIRDFELACVASPIIGMVESILTNISCSSLRVEEPENADSSSDGNPVLVLHEYLTNKMINNDFQPTDVLILSFSLMQIIVRLFVRCTLQIMSVIPVMVATPPISGRQQTVDTDNVFLSAAVLNVPYFNTIPPPSVGASSAAAASASTDNVTCFHICLKALCVDVYEICHECLRDTCVNLLALCLLPVSVSTNGTSGNNATAFASPNSHFTYVHRHSIGMLSEASLSLGLLELQQPCEYLLASLCKYCVPRRIDSTPNDHMCDLPTFRKHHILAFTRVVQVIHILADRVTDWEFIMDTFQQLHQHLSLLSASATNTPRAGMGDGFKEASSNVPGPVLYEEASVSDMAKVFECLEHFKQYSIFLSDYSLVHLMTSIVSLSFTQNDRYQQIAATLVASTNGTTVNELDDRISAIDGNVGQYVEGTYALFTVITIVKLNLYRLSSIWQMISTHLRRLVSTSKIATFRLIIIESMLDLITTSLKYMVQYPSSFASAPGTPVAKELDSAALKHAIKHASFLQDDEDVLVATMAATSLAQASHGGKRISQAFSATNSASNTNILSSLSSAAQFFVPRKKPSSEKKIESVPSSLKRVSVASSKVSSMTLSSFVSPALSVLSDGFYLNVVCPTLDTAFVPREFHKHILTERYKQAFMNGFSLTQADLLSSLKSMATMSTPILENGPTHSSDLRHETLLGVYRILQEADYLNNISSEGWITIIEVISLVPSSHCPVSSHSSDGAEKGIGEDERGREGAKEDEGRIPLVTPQSTAWSNDSLSTAFSCIKLISEDFIHVLSGHVVIALIYCYFMFCVQQTDVNISLTSVELLWKLSDYTTTMTGESSNLTITSQTRGSSDENVGMDDPARVEISDVVDAMMSRLLVLSSDPRPEIRNCAMKTLFAAMVAYVNHLPPLQWKAVFERVIFPLFAQTADRSGAARRNHMEAIAPEIKKGVKMSLHHSRDTAQKQWAETRVVALRGLTRVIKVSTRTLMGHSWFVSHCWRVALEVCVLAVQDASIDLEVAVAGIEVLFAMFKVVSINGVSNWNITSCPENNALDNVPNVHDTCIRMCNDVWTVIQMVASSYEMTSVYELSMKFCNGLSELYATEEEFRGIAYIRPLLQLMVKLSRRRLRDGEEEIKVMPLVDEEESKAIAAMAIFMRPKTNHNAMLQFQRAWILLMKSIVTSLSRISDEREGEGNSAMFNALCSQALCFVVIALSDVIYGGYSPVRISCVVDIPRVLKTEDALESFQDFGPVDSKLRVEAGSYLSQLFTSYGTLSTISGSAALQDSKESKGLQGSMSVMDSIMVVTMCNIVWHRFVFNVVKPANVVKTLNSTVQLSVGADGVSGLGLDMSNEALGVSVGSSRPGSPSRDTLTAHMTTPTTTDDSIIGVLEVFDSILASSQRAPSAAPVQFSSTSLPTDNRVVSTGVKSLPYTFHLYPIDQFIPLFHSPGVSCGYSNSTTMPKEVEKKNEKYGIWADGSVGDIQQLLLCFERKVHHSVKVTSFCLSPDSFVNGKKSGSPDLLSLGLLKVESFGYALKGLMCVLMPHQMDGKDSNDGKDGSDGAGIEEEVALVDAVTVSLSGVLDQLLALGRILYDLDNQPSTSSHCVKLLITQVAELLCCLSNMFVQVSSCTISCLCRAASRAPLVFHYSCLVPLMSFLQRLVNCVYIPIVTRKSALKGILDISQDLVACCVANTASVAGDDYSLQSICEKYLDGLLYLSCPSCILPTSYIVRGHHNPTETNPFTLGGSVKTDNIPYDVASQYSSSSVANMSTSTTEHATASAVSLRNQGHIVLLLPMLYQLLSLSSFTLPVSAQTNGIRKVVLELVSSMDMAELMRVYIRHLDGDRE